MSKRDAHEILLNSPKAAPILLAVGAYILANHIFGEKRILTIPVALITGALGTCVPAAWSLAAQRGSPKEHTAAAPKRILWRLGMLLLTGLCLLIALLFVYHGFQVRNLLLIAIGFLSALLCCSVLAATILHGLGLRANELVSAVVGLVIAVGLSAFVYTASQVEVGPACYGQGVASSAPYSEGPGPHPVEVLHLGRRMWDPAIPTIRYSPLPTSWRPASAEDTELVACVGRLEKYVIQTCTYRGGSDVTRYGYRRQVTLVTARTGEIIASETFAGEPPRSCRQTEERSVRTLKGSKLVDPDEVWGWLSEYVVPGQEYGSGPDVEQPLLPDVRPEPSSAAPTEEPVPDEVSGQEPPAVPEEVQPEPPEPPVEELPQAIVTPGSQPPAIGVLTANPSLWSGPDHRGEHLGIILEEGELVEILSTTDRWTQIRWLSPEGTEVTGWVLSQWVGTPTSLPPTPDAGP